MDKLILAIVAGFGFSFVLIGCVGVMMGDGFLALLIGDDMYYNMFLGMGIACSIGAFLGAHGMEF